MDNLLVSIIIPTYNNADKIVETLDTVFNQTYDNIEVIVIDDGSTDKTEDVVLSYKVAVHQNKKLIYYKQDNAGAPAARNKGLEMATGTLVKFLDSDDVLYDNDVLNKQVNFLNEGGYDIVYGTEVYYQDNFKEENILRQRGNHIDPNVPKTFWKYVPITSNFLLKKGANPQDYRWNELLKRSQEFYLLFNYFLRNAKFGFIDIKAVKIRIHDSPYRISNKPKQNIIKQIAQSSSFMRDDIARLKPDDTKLKAHFNFGILVHSLYAYKVKDMESYKTFKSLMFKVPASSYSLKQRIILNVSKISPVLGNISNKITVRLARYI